MAEFRFVVTVDAATEAEASQVMTERLDPYEDYGFPYTVRWTSAPLADVIDHDGTNATASMLLDEHHAVVGDRDAEGFLDNCERCGFATGWVQPTTLGEDHWGHATSCSSDEVRAWMARNIKEAADAQA